MAKAMISDSSVVTAVGFLDDVAKKHWNEADLRRYLIGKQGLSTNQVTEAFRIHRSRSSSFRKEPNGKNLLEMEICSKMEMSPGFMRSGSGHRPERMVVKPKHRNSEPTSSKTTSSTTNSANSSTSFLLSDKQEDGEKLIRDFLVCERVYCIVLESLKEYHKELTWQARKGTIILTQEEVDKMFHQIPELHRFHKAFYEDLMIGANLGRLFIRRLSFFKSYGIYIKDLINTIDKLRDHIHDINLHSCFAEIRKRSRLTRNDLEDLLVTPVNRIMDYEVFLIKLYEWADKTYTVEYEYFAKAMRRIGRIAKYINTYRHGIINRCEMNRVQRYLGKQVTILNNTRSIIRRGMITRRLSGFMARKKTYHFFLFSDVLLWTTKTGALQNVVELLYCQILPWDSKKDSRKRFKIVVDMRSKAWTKQTTKTILLECKTEETKEEWYKGIESSIKFAKWQTSESRPEEIKTKMMDDSEDEIIESVKPKTSQNDDIFAKVLDIDADVPSKRVVDIKRENALAEDRRTPTETSSIDGPSDGVYHDRYDSHNFIDQQFKDIGPMDDTESQISEYDLSFFEKYGTYQDGVNSLSIFSPHQKFPPQTMSHHNEKTGWATKQEEKNDLMIHSRKGSCVIKRRRSSIFRESLSGALGTQRRNSFLTGYVISLEDLDVRNDKLEMG